MVDLILVKCVQYTAHGLAEYVLLEKHCSVATVPSGVNEQLLKHVPL